MTREEAIKQIRKDICCEKPIQHYCRDGCMKGKEHCAYSLAIADMEKQIPKKCVEKPNVYPRMYWATYCPTCHKELYDENFRVGYCDCGQALRGE